MNNHAKWMETNEQYLAAVIEWIRIRLQQLASLPSPLAQGIAGLSSASSQSGRDKNGSAKNESTALSDSACSDEALKKVWQKIIKLEKNNPPPALLLLAQYLGLSVFERHVLALCTAMELDTRIAGLCARAQSDLSKPYPTFALAFALFDDPDWGALSPHNPLRYWRLIDIHQPGAQPLTSAALSADERIVNYLKGLNYLDDRLMPLLDRVNYHSTDETLPFTQQQVVDNIINHLKQCHGQSLGRERLPVIELLGHDAASKQLIAGRVASLLGSNLYSIDIKTMPGQTGDFENFIRLWQRESRLMPLALYIEVNGITDAEKTKLRRFLERGSGVVFVDLEDAKTELIRNRFSIEVDKPVPEEQEQLWLVALQDQGGDLPQRLAEQFSFSQTEINRLAYDALDEVAQYESTSNNEPALNKTLWQSSRIAARAGMEQLAKRIDVKAEWDQLVLPPEQKALLQQIIDQVVQRNRVYDDWGFRARMNRGLGINALFAGESGTGKTMAAEVIANRLELDLYRIDLSSVVSKYIGETEKNLRKLFDTAEDSGAILFFDEADALFGKRSEVKDSHDRYANIEINYLLQRMESYRGLAILATNLKSALDKAFARRIRFIVDFPFPGIEERKAIWQTVFPATTPKDDKLDFDRLAKLNLTGGNIHNIALNAAFHAAQALEACDRVVAMPLLLHSARTEFKKLERPAKESDFRWLDNTEEKRNTGSANET